MKLNLVILLSTVFLGGNIYAQTSGGAGGGTTAGAGGATVSGGATGQGAGVSAGASTGTSSSSGQGSTTTSTSTSGGVRVAPQPMLPGNGAAQPNPYLPPRAPFPPVEKGNSIQTFATNGLATPLPPAADTNQAVLNANQNPFGGNQVAPGTSNQFGANPNLAPTSQPGFTNRVMATNNPGLLTNNSQLMRDQAVSEPDRRLLGQIQTAVFGSSGAAAPLGGTAVHFILRDGAVRIVGFVPNVEEQKRIEGIVQQVPGVIRVYDALQIGVSATPSVQGQ